MAAKTEIKKILGKGLTGKESARLILQDSWDVDHKRAGFLSEREISQLKASLKTTQDIEDFNQYIDVYKLVDYTLKDARIYALEAEIQIHAVLRSLSGETAPGENPDGPETLLEFHKTITEKVRLFLAIQTVIAAISKVVGVDFSEDLQSWQAELEKHMGIYNRSLAVMLQPADLAPDSGLSKLDPFKTGRLKPGARSLKYYQDRMAIALGKDWWQEGEGEGQDRPAEQRSAEIQAAKAAKDPKEVADGPEA